jgi:hypothetical protein
MTSLSESQSCQPQSPQPEDAAPRRVVFDGRVGMGSIAKFAVLAVCLVTFFVHIDDRLAALEANFGEFKGDMKSALLRIESKLDRTMVSPKE